MKNLYFLLFFAFTFFANAQIVNIPDANFKAKLLSANTTNTIAKDINQNNIKIDINNNNQIEISEALEVYYLDVNNLGNPGLYISNLNGLENFTNIVSFKCHNNVITDINFPSLLNLKVLEITSNPIVNFNILPYTNLERFICIAIGTHQVIDLSSFNNLKEFACSGSNIYFVNLKNGSYETLMLFNSNLQYLCVDDNQINLITSNPTNYNLSNCNVNSYCSFVPGGAYYEISGNTNFDFNANGCDANDINYPNLKFNITDGTNSGNFIANSSGEYHIPVHGGFHTVTPVLQNPSYFNISPTTVTVDFPTQASPFTQDFCVTANGVHSDVEVLIVPITPARPGFDADYKIVYRNKGNQIENGTVTFTYFQEDALDFVIATPVFDNQNTTGNTSIYTWNYTNLQPFETREINVTINLNGPMETPPLNAGDILSIEAQVTTTNNDENLSDNY